MSALFFQLGATRAAAPPAIEDALGLLRRRPHGTLLVRARDGIVLAFAKGFRSDRVAVPRVVSP